MGWRGLHLSQAARLRLKQNRLAIERDSEAALEFPVEDLAWIVLDTGQVNLTAALMAACTEHDVPIIVCDERHMPCGTLLPFHGHFRQTEVMRRQMGLGVPLKKRLWQRIVRAKIANQAMALRRLGLEGADTLDEMRRHVTSGDTANVEARAARFYWPILFAAFKRHGENDRRNAALNYGYAIVRAAIARTLVAHGYLPALGLHHDGVQNAFNLADDFIEPFRPFVDELVRRRWPGSDDHDCELSLEDRRALVAALALEVHCGDGNCRLPDAVSLVVQSFGRAIEAGDEAELLLPEFAPAVSDERMSLRDDN